jgi:hypothetical protein
MIGLVSRRPVRQPAKSEAKQMQKHVGWLWIAGFFGLVAAADAQTPSPPAATTQFDGTYAFVSSTGVNETYRTPSGRMGQCQEGSAPRPLVIVQGQARLLKYGGTVGPQGELTMRRDPEPAPKAGWGSPGIEITIRGWIDATGTVRARQVGSGCGYELIWQK